MPGRSGSCTARRHAFVVLASVAALPLMDACGGRQIDGSGSNLTGELDASAGRRPALPTKSNAAGGGSGVAGLRDGGNSVVDGAIGGRSGNAGSDGAAGSTGGAPSSSGGNVGTGGAVGGGGGGGSGGALGSGGTAGPDASVGTGGAVGATGGSGGADASVGSGGATVGTGGASASSGGSGAGGARDSGSAVVFSRTFDVDAYNVALAVDRASGATYVAFNSNSAIDFGSGPVPGLLLVKLDPDGTVAWHKSFPTGGRWFEGLAVDANGNVVMASDYADSSAVGLDAGAPAGSGLFVVKFTSAGTRVFATEWPGAGSVFFRSVAIAPGNRILVGGAENQYSSVDFGNGAFSASECCGGGFVVSLTPNGRVEWSRGSQGFGLQSVAADARGNAIAIGTLGGRLDFDGSVPTTVTTEDFVMARFSPSGDPTDPASFGPVTTGSQIAGTADPDGNVYVFGRVSQMPFGQPAPFAFPGGPSFSPGLSFFMSLTSVDSYRYGFSLPGATGNSLTDVAVTSSRAAWYVGLQQGSIAIGSLFAPDPGGDGALIFRASSAGAVDLLRSYSGGYFLAVDADAEGRPVVVGRFSGGVNFGDGTIPAANPSLVIAKLNL